MISIYSFILSQDKAITMQRVESLHTVEPYYVGKIVAINDLGDIFATTSYSSDVHLLKNGSNSWTNILHKSLTGIYVSPDNSIYVETSTGLYHSTNTSTYDLTQILFSTKVFSTGVNSLGTIYSGTTDGLYRSDNNGTSWSLTYEYPLKMVINSSDVMYIEEYNKGLCRSTDFGITWEDINFNLSKDIEINDIQIAMDGTIFISVKDNGIYKLIDNTWIEQQFNYTNVNSIHAGKDGFIYCSLGDKIYRKTVSQSYWPEVKSTMGRITTFSSNSNKLIAGYTDDMLIFETIDSGLTWTTNGQKIYPRVISLLTFDNYVIVGTENGVFRSDDYGATWSEKQMDFEIYSIALGEWNRIYLGTDDGLFRSSDYGLTWEQRTTSHALYKVLIADDIIYQIGYGVPSRISKSLDHTGTWIPIPNDFNYPKDAVKSTNGRMYIADNWPGIWYTDDEINWVDTGLGDMAGQVEATSNNDVYVYNHAYIRLLRDGESQWTNVLNMQIFDIYINDDIVFAGGYDNILYSLSGTTWTTIYGIPNESEVNAISRDSNGYIYGGVGPEYNGTEFGLYKSNIPLVIIK